MGSRETRLQRREQTAKVERVPVVPALPVFLWKETPEADGVVARYMFPTSGVLERGIVMVEEFEGDSVHMKLRVEDGPVQLFYAYRRPNVEKINLPVPAGTQLTLFSDNLDARKFWITFAWRPRR